MSDRPVSPALVAQIIKREEGTRDRVGRLEKELAELRRQLDALRRVYAGHTAYHEDDRLNDRLDALEARQRDHERGHLL